MNMCCECECECKKEKKMREEMNTHASETAKHSPHNQLTSRQHI